MSKKVTIDMCVEYKSKRNSRLSGKIIIAPARKKDDDIYKLNFNNRVNSLMRKQSK